MTYRMFFLRTWVADDGERKIVSEKQIVSISKKLKTSARVARVEVIDNTIRVITAENGKEFAEVWKLVKDKFSITYPALLAKDLYSFCPIRRGGNE